MNPIALIFHNGRFQEKQSSIAALPANVEYHFAPHEIYLRFPKMFGMPTPIHFIFLGTSHYQCKNQIILEEGSNIILMEEYVKNAAENYTADVSTQISLQKNASLDFYKLQKESEKATHAANFLIEQYEASQLQMWLTDVGGFTAQHAVNVKLKEQHATCALHGLYLLEQQKQNVHHHVLVDHEAPSVQSSMFYKGIVDHASEASFTGRVKVHAHATKVKASQESHHLLLSKHAAANSKPELEIYADDIQCTHGATIGQLDPAALFYLRSRGMDEQHAKFFLQKAFCAEVLDKIEHAAIREYVQAGVGLHEEL